MNRPTKTVGDDRKAITRVKAIKENPCREGLCQNITYENLKHRQVQSRVGIDNNEANMDSEISTYVLYWCSSIQNGMDAARVQNGGENGTCTYN